MNCRSRPTCSSTLREVSSASHLDTVSVISVVISPRFVDGIIADRVYLEVQNFAWAVKTDPEHPLRKAIDTFLVEFAGELQRDPDTIERVERI